MLQTIAHIYNDQTEKFGVPRQSGLAPHLLSRVVMEPAFRSPDAFRGLEAYSHLWLIWEFSEVPADEPFRPTVRPPRLGGNTRVGVFATRSPFRPNRLGLSCVKLEKIEYDTPDGPVLTVSGADLMNRTPVFDIKPYLPYADSVPDARVNEALSRRTLQVEDPDGVLSVLPEEKRAPLTELLSLDPRPAYQEDPERIYGLAYGARQVRFRVQDGTLTLLEITD